MCRGSSSPRVRPATRRRTGLDAGTGIYGSGGWRLGKQSWEELAEDLMATGRQTVQAKDLGPGTERASDADADRRSNQAARLDGASRPSYVVPEVHVGVSR